MRALVVLAAGCVTTPTPPSGSSSTGDTGTPGGSCADEIAPATYVACAETTLALPEYPPFGDPLVVSGSGTVTEVGGALAEVPGSASIEGFEPCGVEHAHQVRIVDDTGEMWTFGWDLTGADDDASASAIPLGSELDFFATFVWFSYSSGGALLLSDDVGPLFVLELEEVLTDEQRGGIAVELYTDQTCVVEADGMEYYQAAFGWTDGEVQLWSGQTATVPLAGRELEVVLGDASYISGCMDGCSEAWWAGWSEAP